MNIESKPSFSSSLVCTDPTKINKIHKKFRKKSNKKCVPNSLQKITKLKEPNAKNNCKNKDSEEECRCFGVGDQIQPQPEPCPNPDPKLFMRIKDAGQISN